MDIAAYTERAEAFVAELGLEHYRHFAGLKPDFEIEAIYGRYPELFDRPAVERLREAAEAAAAAGPGDGERRARYLLGFAVDGYLGQATKAEAAALAEREATLQVELDGEPIPFRQSPVVQANEPDPERRWALEEARLALVEERMNPLYRAALERSHELARELGWPDYRAMYAELHAIDLEALAAQTAGFLAATGSVYAAVADPELERTVGRRLAELRRSDLPRFFRAPQLDGLFPGERLAGCFAETMAGLGIDVAGQANVILDLEQRPTKTPRAFCAPVRVPDEVYLVVPRIGGRDDFAALFHEGGHTEHFAHADPGMPFEFRQLGDNSVTESFAFLFQHLIESPEWLAARLGAGDAAEVRAHARAEKLIFLRRYAAKIAYELELHGAGADLGAMPARYAELLGEATRVPWPEATWMADVDGGFYVAGYLRAWALETCWRRALRESFGERWFEVPEAGGWLKSLWREGQRLPADELLAERLGEQLDFRVLCEEFGAAAPAA